MAGRNDIAGTIVTRSRSGGTTVGVRLKKNKKDKSRFQKRKYLEIRKFCRNFASVLKARVRPSVAKVLKETAIGGVYGV